MPLSRYCPAEQLFIGATQWLTISPNLLSSIYPSRQAVHFDPVQLPQFATPVAAAHVLHVLSDRVYPAAQVVQVLFAQAVQFGNALSQAVQAPSCRTPPSAQVVQALFSQVVQFGNAVAHATHDSACNT
jgi:hypothetical protein